MGFTRKDAAHHREGFLRLLEDMKGGSAVDVAWRYALSKPGQVYSAMEVEAFLRNDPSVEWTGAKYEVKR